MATKPGVVAALVTVVLSLGNCLAPATSRAHPLGNFSISHYTRIRVEHDAIELRYVLDLAEIPTFQELQEAGIVPEVGHASLPAYLDKRAEVLQNGLLLAVSGRRLALHHTAGEILFPPGAGGLPTLKLGFTYRAALPEAAEVVERLVYQDGNFPGRAGWQEIIAVAGAEVFLEQSSVPGTDRSRTLTDYPADLLNSPPQVLAAQMVFRRSAAAPLAPVASIPASGQPASLHGSANTAAVVGAPVGLAANAQRTPRSAFTELITTPRLSLGMLGLAFIVAAGLGALHALEPGHGKTVVAAYLVGTRGTARHALYLGMMVTATHTAGVYLLGVVTLYASQHVVPERLYPWLGIVSGVLIASVGAYLLLQRYADMIHGHTHGHAHGHTHTHEHGLVHAHEPLLAHAHTHSTEHGHEHTHGHSHYAHAAHHHHAHRHADEHQHHHHVPLPDGTVSFRQLLALGITGGIVPCPAALVVLLSAVSLRRVGFGLLLIVAFSAGLAAVLIAIGLLMVYARRFMARFQGEGRFIKRWLPLTSAGLITVLGLAMVVQAIRSAGTLQLRF
jgi:nickel/cobalt exporter